VVLASSVPEVDARPQLDRDVERAVDRRAERVERAPLVLKICR
jgi:hypothetical protein